MQLSLAFVASLLAGSAFAATTTDQIKADITTLDNYLKQLSGDIDQYTGTIPYALQIQIDSVNIDKTLRQATTDANGLAPLNDFDSLAIGLQLEGVAGDVNTTLAKLNSKAATFGELKPIVLKSLYGLKLSTDSFGTALVKKLGFLEQAIAGGVTSGLDTEFNQAIVAYGGKPAKP